MASALVAIFGLALLSIPHCAVMCGPLSAAAGSARSYHLGRALGYTTLGAVAGMIGSRLEAVLNHAWGQAVLSWSLAALLAIAAWRKLRPPGQELVSIGRKPHWLARAVSAAGHRPWILGTVTGLLPCGVLWAALAMAAATGSTSAGAASMLLFALISSVPLFGTAGLVGLAGRRGHGRLVAFAFALGALLLIIRPIPALAANSSTSHGAACTLHAGSRH